MIDVLRQRNFSLLWIAALVSGIGNFILLAALPYFVYATSGSALASGGAFISEMLPMILFPPIGGAYADRWRRKPVLAGSDVLRGLLVLPLIAVHGMPTLWIVYVSAFLGAAVGNFAGPFGSAAIPHVVREDDLGAANAAFSVGGSIAGIIGFPLGGLLLQRSGLPAVVLVDSLSFVVSGLLIAFINVPLEPVRDRSPQVGVSPLRRVQEDWTHGLAVVRSERWLLVFYVVTAFTFLGNGGLWTVLPAFVRSVLGGSPQFYSWVLTAQSIGGVAASISIGWVLKRSSTARTLAIALLAFGLLDGLVALAASRPATLLAFFLAGPPALFGIAALNTILQAESRPDYRGRVFGLYLMINALASVAGSLLAGALADSFGSRAVLGGEGLVVFIGGLVATFALVPALREARAARAA